MTLPTQVDLNNVARLYTDALREHGTVAKGVGWGNEVAHNLRFDKQVQVIDATTPFTVADLGCGYGAFYDYLIEKNLKPSHFIGYDISDDMLVEAKSRERLDTEFIKGSSLDRGVDYTFASGIFNVRLKETEDRWRAFILATLDDINAHSAKGFSFNLLSSYVDWKEDHLYYGDPLFFFDHCKRNYSRQVALLHDYPLWEWTIVVRK